jgi:hypothetical protein
MMVLGGIKPSQRLVKPSPGKWRGPEEPEQKDRAVDKRGEPQGRRNFAAMIGRAAGICCASSDPLGLEVSWRTPEELISQVGGMKPCQYLGRAEITGAGPDLCAGPEEFMEINECMSRGQPQRGAPERQ